MAKTRVNPLLERFDRVVSDDPAAALVVAPGRCVSAADLDAQTRAAASALAANPAPPGEPAALLAGNGPAFLAGLVALLRAGAAPLLLDARTPPAEQARVARELGAPRLLACACSWPRGPEEWRVLRPEAAERALVNGSAGPAAAGRAGGDAVDVHSSSRLPSGAILELPSGSIVKFTSGAVIKLTSGSTGAPRGIVTPVEALLADVEALEATMGIGDGDRLLAAIPFSHSYGLSSLVVPALAHGRTLVMPGEDGPFGPLAAAAEAEATVFPTVPAYLAGLLRLGEPPPLPPSLRLVLTAGAPLPAGTSDRFRELYGRPVHVFYGASECGGICYDREGGAAERGTVGTPVEGVRIEIEEGASGGRVAVHSSAVAGGYLPRSDPRLGGGRFLTDDLGVWRGGELALVGRLGELINVRGKKVNPREVEGVLRSLAAVEEVAVLATPGGGSCDPAVKAVIACAAGSLTREAVLSWCRERLADHKRPRSVVLVDRLPRTARGKLDRAALARL